MLERLLKPTGIRYRWVAEINLHPELPFGIVTHELASIYESLRREAASAALHPV